MLLTTAIAAQNRRLKLINFNDVGVPAECSQQLRIRHSSAPFYRRIGWCFRRPHDDVSAAVGVEHLFDNAMAHLFAAHEFMHLQSGYLCGRIHRLTTFEPLQAMGGVGPR